MTYVLQYILLILIVSFYGKESRGMIIRDLLTEYIANGMEEVSTTHSIVVDLQGSLQGTKDESLVSLVTSSGNSINLLLQCLGVFADYDIEVTEGVPEHIRKYEFSTCESERQQELTSDLLNVDDAPEPSIFSGPNQNLADQMRLLLASDLAFSSVEVSENETNPNITVRRRSMTRTKNLLSTFLQEEINSRDVRIRNVEMLAGRRKILQTQDNGEWKNTFVSDSLNFNGQIFWVLPAPCNQRQIDFAFLGSVANYATITADTKPPETFNSLSGAKTGLEGDKVTNRLIGLRLPSWRYAESRELWQHQEYHRYLDFSSVYLDKTNELLYSITQVDATPKGKTLKVNDRITRCRKDNGKGAFAKGCTDGFGTGYTRRLFSDLSDDNVRSFAVQEQITRQLNVLPIDRMLACADAQAFFLLKIASTNEESIYFNTSVDYLEELGNPSTTQEIMTAWASVENPIQSQPPFLYPLNKDRWAAYPNKKEVLDFYDRLYSAEIETRGKITSRINWQFDSPCLLNDTDPLGNITTQLGFNYTFSSSIAEYEQCREPVNFSKIIEDSGGILPNANLELANGDPFTCQELLEQDGTFKYLYNADLDANPRKHVSDTRCKFAISSLFEEQDEGVIVEPIVTPFTSCVPFRLYQEAIFKNITDDVRLGWQGRLGGIYYDANQQVTALCTDWGEQELFCAKKRGESSALLETMARACSGRLTSSYDTLMNLLVDSLVVGFGQARNPMYDTSSAIADDELLCNLASRGAEHSLLFRSYMDFSTSEVIPGVECPCALVPSQTSTRVCPVNFWARPGFSGQLQACTREKGLPTCLPMLNTQIIGLELRDTKAHVENRCDADYTQNVLKGLTLADAQQFKTGPGICDGSEAFYNQCPFNNAPTRFGIYLCEIMHEHYEFLNYDMWDELFSSVSYKQADSEYYNHTGNYEDMYDGIFVELRNRVDPRMTYFDSIINLLGTGGEKCRCDTLEYRPPRKDSNKTCDTILKTRNKCKNFYQYHFQETENAKNDLIGKKPNPFYNRTGCRCRGHQGNELASEQYQRDSLSPLCVYADSVNASVTDILLQEGVSLASASGSATTVNQTSTSENATNAEFNAARYGEALSFDYSLLDFLWYTTPINPNQPYGTRSNAANIRNFYDPAAFAHLGCVPSIVQSTDLLTQRTALFDIIAQNEDLGNQVQSLSDILAGSTSNDDGQSLLDIAQQSALEFTTVLTSWRNISETSEAITTQLLNGIQQESTELLKSIDDLSTIIRVDFPILGDLVQSQFQGLNETGETIKQSLLLSTEVAEGFRQFTISLVEQYIVLVNDMQRQFGVSESLLAIAYSTLGKLQSLVHGNWRGKERWRKHSNNVEEYLGLALERNARGDLPFYPLVSRFPEKSQSASAIPQEPTHEPGELIQSWQLGLDGQDPTVSGEASGWIAISVQRIWSLVGVDTLNKTRRLERGLFPNEGVKHLFDQGWLWREVRIEVICPVNWLLSSRPPSGLNEFTVWDILKKENSAAFGGRYRKGCSLREVVHECRVDGQQRGVDEPFWTDPNNNNEIYSSPLTLEFLLQKQRETMLDATWAKALLSRDFNSFSAEDRAAFFGCTNGGSFVASPTLPLSRSAAYDTTDAPSLPLLSIYARNVDGLSADMSAATIVEPNIDLLMSELGAVCGIRKSIERQTEETTIRAVIHRQHAYQWSEPPDTELITVALEGEPWLLDETLFLDDGLATILNASISLRREEICSRNSRLGVFVGASTQVLRKTLSVLNESLTFPNITLGFGINTSTGQTELKQQINFGSTDTTSTSTTTTSSPTVNLWESTLTSALIKGIIDAFRKLPRSALWKDLDLGFTGLMPVGGIRTRYETTKILPTDPVHTVRDIGYSEDSNRNQEEAQAKAGFTKGATSDANVYSPALPTPGVPAFTSTKAYENEFERLYQAMRNTMNSGPGAIGSGSTQDPSFSKASYSRSFTRAEQCYTSSWLGHGKKALALHRLKYKEGSLRARFSFKILPNIVNNSTQNNNATTNTTTNTTNTSTTSTLSNIIGNQTILLETIDFEEALIDLLTETGASASSSEIEVPLLSTDILPDSFSRGRTWYWLGDPRCAYGKDETFLTNDSVAETLDCTLPGLISENSLKSTQQRHDYSTLDIEIIESDENNNAESNYGFIYDISKEDVGSGAFRKNKINALYLAYELPSPWSSRYSYDNTTARQLMFSFEDFMYQQYILPAGQGYYRGSVNSEIDPSELNPISPSSRVRGITRNGRCKNDVSGSSQPMFDTCNFMNNFKIQAFLPPQSSSSLTKLTSENTSVDVLIGPKRGRLSVKMELSTSAGFGSTSATVKIPISEKSVLSSQTNTLPCPLDVNFDFVGAASALVSYKNPFGLAEFLNSHPQAVWVLTNTQSRQNLIMPFNQIGALNLADAGIIQPVTVANSSDFETKYTIILDTDSNSNQSSRITCLEYILPKLNKQGVGSAIAASSSSSTTTTTNTPSSSSTSTTTTTTTTSPTTTTPTTTAPTTTSTQNISIYHRDNRNLAVDYSVQITNTINNLELTKIVKDSTKIHRQSLILLNNVVNNMTTAYLTQAAQTDADYFKVIEIANNNISETLEELPEDTGGLDELEAAVQLDLDNLEAASQALDEDLAYLLELSSEKTPASMNRNIEDIESQAILTLIKIEIDENPDFLNITVPDNQCYLEELFTYLESGQSETFQALATEQQNRFFNYAQGLECFQVAFGNVTAEQIVEFLNQSTPFLFLTQLENSSFLNWIQEQNFTETELEFIIRFIFGDLEVITQEDAENLQPNLLLSLLLGTGIAFAVWAVQLTFFIKPELCCQGCQTNTTWVSAIYWTEFTLSLVIIGLGLWLFFDDDNGW